jgi:hypothetical protein
VLITGGDSGAAVTASSIHQPAQFGAGAVQKQVDEMQIPIGDIAAQIAAATISQFHSKLESAGGRA